MLIIIFATLAPMLLDTKWGDHKKEVFKLSIGDLNAWLKLINLAVNLWDAVNDRNFYSSLMKLSSSLCLWDDASSSTLRKLMLANYLLGKNLAAAERSCELPLEWKNSQKRRYDMSWHFYDMQNVLESF